MNFLFKTLALVLFLLTGYWLVQQVFKNPALENLSLDLPSSVEVDISRSYLIPQHNALEYTLSQSPEIIWISSSAILAQDNSNTSRYPYELQVKVYDKNDGVLFSNQFHHQTTATKIVELKANGQNIAEAFTSSPNEKLTAPKNLHIRLPTGATKLVITLAVKSEDIQDVALRAYQYVQRSSRVDAIDLWQRLSQKQKNRLLEFYPFDSTFLTDDEKAKLAEYRWQPLVPTGDENSDYQSKRLYRIPSASIAHKKHLLSNYEQHADTYKRVSFPIEVAGWYRLEGSHAFTEREFSIATSWFNQNDSWEKPRELQFEGTQFQQQMELEPGLLTVTSSIPVSLGLFAISGLVEEHDHFSPATLLTATQSLSFKVTQAKDDFMPVQIQARALAEQEFTTRAGTEVLITLLQKRRVIGTLKMSPQLLPDEDSQLVNEEFFHWLGLPEKRFLDIPQGTDEIQISSNQPVLISAYTRLQQMPSIRTLPEEKRDWYDYAEGVPDWFSMRPDNWADIINRGSIRLLKHYHRSLLAQRDVPDPDETYQSLLQDFSNLTLTDLMVQNPYPGQPSKVEENIDLNFAPLHRNNRFETISPNQKPANNRLFFIKTDNNPEEIPWLKDGKQMSPLWIAGKWGLVDSSVTGTDIIGDIQLQSAGVQWWRNGVPREQTQWQLRRAALLQRGDSITLSNTKESPVEALSLVLYTTGSEEIELNIELQNVRRLKKQNSAYTIAKRKYLIQPKEFHLGYQIAGKRRIRGRQAFSLVLNEDIDLSEHQIKISHNGGDDIYLSMMKRVIKPAPIIQRYRMQEEH